MSLFYFASMYACVRHAPESGCFGSFLPGCLCVVKRCSFSVGAIPTRQRSLQPVAIGAAVEVTKPSKPSRQHAAWRCGE